MPVISYLTNRSTFYLINRSTSNQTSTSGWKVNPTNISKYTPPPQTQDIPGKTAVSYSARRAVTRTTKAKARSSVFHFKEQRRPVYSDIRLRGQKQRTQLLQAGTGPDHYNSASPGSRRKRNMQAEERGNPSILWLASRFPLSPLEKRFTKPWRWDVRPYLQKAGAGTELVVRYLVLKVWKLLPGTEQREYLLLVVWNRSHHQNYLQIPKIKEEQCYIWYKPAWEQILKTYANIGDKSIYSLIWNIRS